MGRGSLVAVWTWAGRSAPFPAGAAARAAGSRWGAAAGGWAAGWLCGWDSRVTVPLRLKLESSRGPMSAAGLVSAGAADVELS